MIQLKAAESLKIQQHRVTHINTIRLCNTPNLKKKKKSYSAAGDNRLINQVKVLYGLFMWETESGRIKEFIHFFFILCACGTFFEIDADNVF